MIREKSRGLGPLENLIGLQLRLAQLKFFDAFYADFAEDRITPAEYAILVLLEENPGLRQGVLADMLRIKRSNMTKVVRALEDRGLITRSAPPSDGRAFELNVTEKAKRLRAALGPAVADRDAAAAGGLTEMERAELLRLLHKLTGGSQGRDSQAPQISLASISGLPRR